MFRPKLLLVVGPTASGKTGLGVELARQFHGEVISADSRQVYRGLDIGTGKATKKEMRGIPHHLLDAAAPRTTFTADRFTKKARAAIAAINKHDKLPIVVGGTGFYIDALVGRLSIPRVPPNATLRKRLASKSAEELLAELQEKDPDRAATIEPQNKRRIIRALEIVEVIGKVPALVPVDQLPYDTLWIGVRPSDQDLRNRITKRLAARLKSGMVAEAKRLHAEGLSYKRMRELGLEYRSLARFLEGEISRERLEEELQSNIWRYARKQIGYFGRNASIHWFEPKQLKEITALTQEWLSE